ncbi:MAG: tripartite tricarboxylate transporter substrate binding protein [Betaproteobacteria bacterium]|nr:tripartite tricarboxylate transporter substrate binding protein [Betaproteobacteria bacterium]
MISTKRRALAWSAILGVVGVAGHAPAQEYPASPVRVIVPFQTGGTLDTITRLITPKLTEAWKQQMVIDNRAGAGGNIGAQLAARAKPDGYTLFVNTPAFAVNPSLTRKLPYDPMKDFAPVSLLAWTNGVLLVPPTLPVRNVKELIALAKSRPGELTYASTGPGTAGHLNMELFKSLTGINVLHVPYKSIGQAQTDLMAGRIILWITSLPGAVPHIQSGRMRALAVSGTKRSAGVPDVPTMQEAGVKSYEAVSWYGMFVPGGTPTGVIEKINAAAVRAVRSADVKERFNVLGVEPVGSSPAELGKYLQAEITKWAGLVKKIGLRAD